MRFLSWGIIGAAAIFGVMKRFGLNNAQQMTQSAQQGNTPVANSNPLTANTPKQ